MMTIRAAVGTWTGFALLLMGFAFSVQFLICAYVLHLGPCQIHDAEFALLSGIQWLPTSILAGLALAFRLMALRDPGTPSTPWRVIAGLPALLFGGTVIWIILAPLLFPFVALGAEAGVPLLPTLLLARRYFPATSRGLDGAGTVVLSFTILVILYLFPIATMYAESDFFDAAMKCVKSRE
jgi:hypothetical protein